MEKKTSRKKALTTTVIIVLLALIGGTIGGAIAYFSGTAETKEFKFIAGAGKQNEDGSIVIEAPRWEEPENPLAPGQLLPTDPDTLSKVEYDGYCIMKVTSPKIMATIGDETEFSAHEAFKFIGLNVGEGKDFIELKKEDTDKAVIYYYGFKNVLEAGEATTKLFTAIQLNDFTSISENQEGMVDKKMDGHVDVDAAIVQNVDPSTGQYFASVQAAFQALGESFEAGNANFS